MRITASQAEIQSAVVAFFAKRGVVIEGMDIAVSFSMGRKNTGLSATIDLNDPEIKELPTVQEEETVEETPAPTPVVETPVATSQTTEVTQEASSDAAAVVSDTADVSKEAPFDTDSVDDAPVSNEPAVVTSRSLFAQDYA